MEVLFLQGPKLPKDIPPRRLLDQEIEWQEHNSYGTIPVELHSTSDVFVDITTKDGVSKSVQGYNRFDVNLNWNEFRIVTDNVWLLKDVYTQADIDEFVGNAVPK